LDHPDYHEGVKARILEHRKPNWSYKDVKSVPDTLIDEFISQPAKKYRSNPPAFYPGERIFNQKKIYEDYYFVNANSAIIQDKATRAALPEYIKKEKKLLDTFNGDVPLFIREEENIMEEEYIFPPEFSDHDGSDNEGILINLKSSDITANRTEKGGAIELLNMIYRSANRSRILDDVNPLETAEDIVMREAQMSEEELQELQEARLRMKHGIYAKEDDDLLRKIYLPPVYLEEEADVFTEKDAHGFDENDIPPELLSDDSQNTLENRAYFDEEEDEDFDEDLEKRDEDGEHEKEDDLDDELEEIEEQLPNSPKK